MGVTSGMLGSPAGLYRCPQDLLGSLHCGTPCVAASGGTAVPATSTPPTHPSASMRLRRTAMAARFILVLGLLAAIARGAPRIAPAQDSSLTIFAAASMKNALDDANAAFTRATGIKVVVSYAA